MNKTPGRMAWEVYHSTTQPCHDDHDACWKSLMECSRSMWEAIAIVGIPLAELRLLELERILSVVRETCRHDTIKSGTLGETCQRCGYVIPEPDEGEDSE